MHGRLAVHLTASAGHELHVNKGQILTKAAIKKTDPVLNS